MYNADSQIHVLHTFEFNSTYTSGLWGKWRSAMTKFPFEHLDGCLPHTPCVCCETLVFLKDRLDSWSYRQFLNLAHKAYGEDGENTAEIQSDSPWEPYNTRMILSTRACNCLRKDELVTFNDIASRTEAELLRTLDFGPKCLGEVKEFLNGFGFRLAQRSN